MTERKELARREGEVRASPAGEPLVSVMIPCYKPEHFRECLDSAIHQTYSNLEILIGDDNPSGAIQDIVSEYAATDPRIAYERHVRETSRGGARENHVNLFRSSTGEYAKFLHDDDYLDLRCVERMVGCLRDHPNVSLVYCHSQVIGPDGERFPDPEWARRRVDQDSIVDGISLANAILAAPMNMVGGPSGTMFRRKDLADNQPSIMSFAGRDAVWNGDVAMWLTLLMKGDAICLVDSLCYYRIHDNQRTKTSGCIEMANTAWGNFQEDGRALGLLSSEGSWDLISRPLGSARVNPSDHTGHS